MITRNGYKNGVESPENRRVYVIPITGKEAQATASFGLFVEGKSPNGKKRLVSTERWPCDYVYGSNRIRGVATVLRFMPSQFDSRLARAVERQLEKIAVKNSIHVLGGVFKAMHIEYLEPYDGDAW